MPQGIAEIKDKLAEAVGSGAFSLDSMEGVLVVLICVIFVYRITRDMGDFAGWCIGALFLIQLCYVLGLTVIEDYIPFSAVFKFDVITSVASLFKGTFICDWLLYMAAFVGYIGKVLAGTFEAVFPPLSRIGQAVFKNYPIW